MSKIYYRCRECYDITTTKYAEVCKKCGCCSRVYAYQHYHWWETLYLTIRGIYRGIKQAWREIYNANRI